MMIEPRDARSTCWQYAWKIGNVAVRELADHAPVNYVSGIIGRML